MSFFKQRKPRTFNYTPRHLDDTDKIQKNDLESQWRDMRQAAKRKKSIFSSLPYMVLFLIGILILLYILTRYE